jgi:NADH-quinone oxidoreductase subunit J
MNLSVALFYLLAGLTGLCAIAVVVTQNIVRAAAWLLFTLAGVAGLLFLLGASFVGATQLLVYVGGTLVLVVFGVMLTAQGPFISMKTGAAEWGVSTVVGIMLYGVLAVALISRPAGFTRAEEQATDELTDTTTLGLSLLGFDQATPIAKVTNRPDKQVERKRVSYLLPFEIVSVHLLVVLIGAAYLARTKKRRSPTMTNVQ